MVGLALIPSLECTSPDFRIQSKSYMQNCQGEDMDEKIKSYRQAIFKLDHAERKRGEVLESAYLTAVQSHCICIVFELCLRWAYFALPEVTPSCLLLSHIHLGLLALHHGPSP